MIGRAGADEDSLGAVSPGARPRPSRFHLSALVGGAMLMALALLNPIWVLLFPGPLELDDPVVIAALIVFDAWALATLILCIRRGRRLRIGELVRFNLALLAVAVVIELSLHALNRVRTFHPEWAPPDSRRFLGIAELPPFRDKPWAPALMRETLERYRQVGWHPYLGLQFGAYAGTYVNVDDDGLRKTWNPPETPGGAPRRQIYVFGGSTTYCEGARDEYTLPSFLSKRLNAAGDRAVVHNAGEMSYGVEQEVLKLLFYLRSGHRIDGVVFYDGINEVASFLEGQAGRIQGFQVLKGAFDNAKQLVFVLNPTERGSVLGFMGLQSLAEDNLYSLGALGLLVTTARNALGHPRHTAATAAIDVSETSTGPKRTGAEIQAFATAVVDHYAATLGVLDALSRAYSFRYATFWQPMLPLEDTLFDDERAGAKSNHPIYFDADFAEVHRLATEELQRRALPHHHDFSRVLYGRTEPFYFDGVHLTENGNAFVADRMAAVLEGELMGH